MMIVVRSFYQDFVQSVAANNRKPPPANFYSPRRAGGGIAVDCLDAYFLAVGDKEAHVAMGSSNFYKDFLDRTAFLSGKQSAGQFYSNESGSMCELLAVLGEESVQRGNNCSFFKD